MKNQLLLPLFLVCLLFGFSNGAYAQSKTINRFIKKQGRLAESEHLNIGGFVLKIASKFVDDDDASQIVRHLSRLRVMTVPEASRISAKAIQTLKQGVRSESFEDFFMAREGGQRIEVLVRDTEDGITDLLLLIQERDEDKFTLVSVEGLFRFSDLKDLSLEFEGSDILEDIARN
jgi:hypothetical protein